MTDPKLSVSGVLTTCAGILSLITSRQVDGDSVWSDLAVSLSDHLPPLPSLPPHRFSRFGAKLVAVRWEHLTEQQCWEWTRYVG